MVHDLLERAVSLHRAHRLNEAFSLYRTILGQHPDQFDALYLGGLIALDRRWLKSARILLQAAVRLAPAHVLARHALVRVLRDTGHAGQAVEHARRLLCLVPDEPARWSLLASCCFAGQDVDAARRANERAVRLWPNHAPFRREQAMLVDKAGWPETALSLCRHAVALDPTDIPTLELLVKLLGDLGHNDDAFRIATRTVRTLAPQSISLLRLLASMYDGRGNKQAGAACLRRALMIAPADTATLCALAARQPFPDAVRTFERAIRIDPEDPWLRDNYAIRMLWTEGPTDRCIEAFRRNIALGPAIQLFKSNYLFALCYADWPDNAMLHAEHVRLAPQVAAPHPPVPPPSAAKVIRIGYVSGDFNNHPVAAFFEPVLAHHDRTRVHVTCYSQGVTRDNVTRRLKDLADQWREIRTIPDARLAEMIREDRIDVLVDLSGHTADNRVSVFAHKPAPVQVAWLGYGATSGVAAMDYILADPYAIPPGHERHYSEKPWIFSKVYRTIRLDSVQSPVAPLPMARTGYPTFGYLNTPMKITPSMVSTWSSLLGRWPSAKMFFFADGSKRNHIARQFADHGIPESRLIFSPHLPYDRFVKVISERIDLSLDPFPHNGGTTTFQTLWMGVPVLTLAGERFVSRFGLSILTTLGLPELITTSAEEYSDRAIALVSNPAKLAGIRAELRSRLESSPFLDHDRFTRELEDAFFRMHNDAAREAFTQAAPSSMVPAPRKTDEDPIKPMVPLRESLLLAVNHQNHGRLEDAEHVYNRILAEHPTHAGTLYIAGMLAKERGQTDLALRRLHEAFRFGYQSGEIAYEYGRLCLEQGLLPHAVQALEAASQQLPENAEIAFRLGDAQQQSGNRKEATQAYRRVLDLDPGNTNARFLLAQALSSLGRPEEALCHLKVLAALVPDQEPVATMTAAILYSLGRVKEGLPAARKAARLAPQNTSVQRNLAVMLQACGHFEEAMRRHRQRLLLDPASETVLREMGMTAESLGDLDTAIACLRRTIRMSPHHADLWNYLGLCLCNRGRLQEGQDAYRTALQLDPAYASAWSGLANILSADNAIPLHKRAIRLLPGFVEAWNNLAGSYRRAGETQACIEAYRQALKIAPDHAAIHSNMLLCLCYADGISPRDLMEEHCQWADRFEAPLLAKTAGKTFANDRSTDRILRIGYVSGDYCDHAAAFFIAPLLEAHNRSRVHVTCYAQVPNPDGVTEYLRQRADAWVNAVPLSDEALAARIEQDRIDILVDISGHTGRNRLQVFARKPAPIQCTWLGYASTTGMRAIDYQLVDRWAVPAGGEQYYTEAIWRLPRTYRTFQWLVTTPDIAPPPMATRGYPTFGSLNAFVKVEPHVVALWSRLLHRVPTARLLVIGYFSAQQVLKAFGAHGIGPERLELLERMSLRPFLAATSERVDLALDPFPHNGGTTTFHTLWSGIPLLTIEGDRFTSRLGTAILDTLGLPQLIAQSSEDFLDRAVALVSAPDTLAEIRASLRERMRQSPFLDYPGFARDMEDAYRAMWQKWLRGESPKT